MTILGYRSVLLADGLFRTHQTKTAMGIIRNAPNTIMAVIDRSTAGKSVGDIKKTNDNIPIIDNIHEILDKMPQSIVMGAYPENGILPSYWREQILIAVQLEMNIVSWFHQALTNDVAIAKAVNRKGINLYDVRQPPNETRISQNIVHPKDSFTVLTVGSDCSVGKMTASLAIQAEAVRQNLNCNFVATGQAGIILSGKGSCIDNIAGDYIAGEAEKLVLESLRNNAWSIIEGQGAIIHPSFSGVALSLLHGVKPDALVLCHDPTRITIKGTDVVIPSLPNLIQIYESAASWINQAPVIGIALNCQSLSEEESIKAIHEAEKQTGLPATDSIKYGTRKLINALKKKYKQKLNKIKGG
ncbi:MAG: DUF1611 domain-containing protein [Desulfobacterales bacterium]|nr:DUF1611 domain-containing protein [Desulfobacterales bacterium]